ncbi:MAG TPA: rhodanese-like domain-containing protein [Candidatus Limnocylindria bacterium]|nr:rhodanese-like domain-containing protein [Candidatus Limnocylindria bacterium]
MSNSTQQWRWLLPLAAWVSVNAWATTPAELSATMTRGDKVTVIDIRSTDVYANGHIPGAINVPAAIVAEKRLPRLGKVIVYDDGLGTDKATDAAAKLSQKPGISAEVLQGGFSAWETANAAATTRGAYSKEESLPRITYQELKTLPAKNLVLVDLRQSATTASGKSTKSIPNPNAPPAAPAAPLTDLHGAFPGARISTSAFGKGVAAKTAGDSAPLIVLIDNGDGVAEATARQLRANGVQRFTILAGGEQIIARDGMPGKQRLGAKVSGPIKLPTLSNGN